MVRRRTPMEPDEAERLADPPGAVVPNKTTDLWVETQARLFEQADEVARRWLDRRREALDAALQSMEEMRRASDIGDLMRIQQEWVLGAVRRVTADITELTGAALTFSRASASRIGQAGEGVVHDLERTGQEALSAAGSKPHLRTTE
jgi:hypothetical protein